MTMAASPAYAQKKSCTIQAASTLGASVFDSELNYLGNSTNGKAVTADFSQAFSGTIGDDPTWYTFIRVLDYDGGYTAQGNLVCL